MPNGSEWTCSRSGRAEQWVTSRTAGTTTRAGRKIRSDRYGAGKRWKARYEIDGRARSTSFDRKIDADAHLVTVGAEALRGEYADRADRRTVTQYAREWAATRPHGPRTAKRVESMIRAHIESTTLGRRRLSDVRPSEVQAWATDRGRVLAPATLRKAVSLLRSVYAAAVLDRLVGSSPVVRLQLAPAHRQRVVPLSVDQVRTLAAAMPARNRAMVLAQAGLGLRISELLALRLADIDFLRRTARVEWQIAPHERVRVPPKTPGSKRTVPLPRVVGEALAEHVRAFPPAEDGSLFTARDGRPYRDDGYGGIFGRAVGRCIDEQGTELVPAGTTSHALRHHYASVLLAAGESVVAVAERLGHEDAALVLRTYGHLMPNTEDRTRRAVDDAWSDDTATSRPRPEELG